MTEVIRTCLGCRRKADKKEFFRLAVRNNEVVFDEKYILPGRGTYSCKKKSCLKRIYKNKKKLAALFRCDQITWHSDIVKFIKL